MLFSVILYFPLFSVFFFFTRHSILISHLTLDNSNKNHEPQETVICALHDGPRLLRLAHSLPSLPPMHYQLLLLLMPFLSWLKGFKFRVSFIQHCSLDDLHTLWSHSRAPPTLCCPKGWGFAPDIQCRVSSSPGRRGGKSGESAVKSSCESFRFLLKIQKHCI